MEKNRYYVSIADVSIGIKTDFDVSIWQKIMESIKIWFGK